MAATNFVQGSDARTEHRDDPFVRIDFAACRLVHGLGTAACAGNNNCKGGFFAAPGTRATLASACGAMQDVTQDGVLCCAD